MGRKDYRSREPKKAKKDAKKKNLTTAIPTPMPVEVIRKERKKKEEEEEE